MADVTFYIFAAITLISALVMVLSPNAVNAAMAMIVSFVGTAALFVLLEAYFLAALQVLVYAGAVMVLFLFIIMLVDTEKVDRISADKISIAAASVGAVLFIVMLGSIILGLGELPEVALTPASTIPEGTEGGFAFTTAAKSFGYGLFTKYMLPFQVAGFLLLTAMIGVIVVSKKYIAVPTPEPKSPSEKGGEA